MQDTITAFLAGSPFAVVGASRDRSKYGNKALRAYLQAGRDVYPVHPSDAEIEGLTAYASLSDLPVVPHGISIVTPPRVTQAVVREAIALGIPHIWMQPGAESDVAVAEAEAAGAQVIHDGPCILVALRYRETA